MMVAVEDGVPAPAASEHDLMSSEGAEAPAQVRRAPSRRLRDMDQRAALFGTRLCSAGASAAAVSAAKERGRRVADAYAAAHIRAEQEKALLEERNNELAEDLHDKVAELRQVSLEISKEVNVSNSALDAMHGSFDRVHAMVTKTTARVQQLAKEPGGRNFMLMCVFCVLLLVCLYFGVLGHLSKAAAVGAKAVRSTTKFLASGADMKTNSA